MLIVFLTLYITYLVFLYLEVCSTFSCLHPLHHPSPQPQPDSLVTTYLTSFFYEFVCMSVCVWSIMDLQQYVSFCYTTLIWHFCKFKNDRLVKSSYDVTIQRYHVVSDCIPHTVHLVWFVFLQNLPCWQFDLWFLCLFESRLKLSIKTIKLHSVWSSILGNLWDSCYFS